jgi:ribosomal protein S21
MAVVVAQGESIDSAYRRFIKELIVNGTFKELEKNRYHIPEGNVARDIRRQMYKTKRKRAQARRKVRHKRV